jgi:four helix bundle protein
MVERFGMVSQMQRASVSVASNIAEGAGRKSRADFVNFLYYALGSAFELETQLIICFEVGLITKEEQDNLIATIHDIQPMIHGLIHRMQLEDKEKKGR